MSWCRRGEGCAGVEFVKEGAMSNAELIGRMAALEVVAMTALGLAIADSRNDPNNRKSGALLATMRDALKTQATTLPEKAQKHAIG
jgi:hypothetical protein